MLEYSLDWTHFLRKIFVKSGMNADLAGHLNLLVNIVLLGIVLYISFYAIKRIVIGAFIAFTNKTKTTFDDFLVKGNFPKYAGNIFPIILLNYFIPIIFEDYPKLLNLFNFLLNIYIIILVILICRSVLRTAKSYLSTREAFKDKPLDSYIQVMMIFIWFIGFVFIFSEITQKDPLNFLISLGAASAIILLIFKDTILGFVASIQVSVNDIVRMGDWITFSKYGADGFVTEISLATVIVQNWDKTLTSIPTYSLISDSFQNWRGMQESPGRQIKHSLFIKQNSVKFVTDEDLDRYKKFELVSDYLEERQKTIEQYNLKFGVDREVVVNGRNQTNLGVFRKYTNTYLQKNPKVSQELFVMARMLSPTTHGIPLEIYCFSREKSWVNYEGVKADIFEHLIAAMPYFDLKLFEEPSGDDITKLASYFSSKAES